MGGGALIQGGGAYLKIQSTGGGALFKGRLFEGGALIQGNTVYIPRYETRVRIHTSFETV